MHAANDILAGDIDTEGSATLTSGHNIKTAKIKAANDADLDAANNIDAGAIVSGGDTTLNAGNNINSSTVDSAGNVLFTAVNNIDAGFINSQGDISLIAGYDITSAGANAAGKILLSSTNGTTAADGGVITLNGVLTSQSSSKQAVVVGTEGIFNNQAGSNAISTPNGNWQVYSYSPVTDTFQELKSGNLAQWGHTYTAGLMSFTTDTDDTIGLGHYIFQVQPTITVKANDSTKLYGITSSGSGVSTSVDAMVDGSSLLDYDVFTDSENITSVSSDAASSASVASDGFAADAAVGTYTINVTGLSDTSSTGYIIQTLPGTLTVTNALEAEKPKLDYLDTSNLDGNGNYAVQSGTRIVTGVERVAGLTSAELPFFKVANRQVSSYGTYDITESPEEVKLTASAKYIPAPNKPATQYRSLEKDITLANGEGRFTLSYNGSKLDIYPTDSSTKEMLKAGDASKNEEISSKALHASFNEMGLVLEDLDAIYVHTDATETEAKR